MPAHESQQFEELKKAFQQLLQKQEALETRLTHLESSLGTAPLALESEPPPPVPETAAWREASVPEEAVEPIPASLAAEEQHAPAEPAVPSPGLESKVGLTLVNRIGAVTLVFGIAFFFKWAVDNNWIGPAGRVMLGLLAGFATLAAGDFMWRKGQQVFAQGITVTGLAITYLSIYAAFDFYQLIPQAAAFVLMVATTAMGGVLALRYKSVAIAALGLAGAYMTPLLLSTGEDHPWFLFSYLLLLNLAATELGKLGNWPKLEYLSFAATTLLYGGWLLDRGKTPEKRFVATLAPLAFSAQRWFTRTPFLFVLSEVLSAFAIAYLWYPQEANFLFLSLLLAAAALAFAHVRQYPAAVLGAFIGFWSAYSLHLFRDTEPSMPLLGITGGFALFTAWTYWRLVVKRETPTTAAMAIFSLNGVLFYAHAYQLLRVPAYALPPGTVATDHHLWLGPLAALVAGVYLAFGIFVNKATSEEGGDKRPVLLALGIALAFLTLAIPIQFTGFTITIAWAIQGAALTWIAWRLQSMRASVGALTVLALVALRLIIFETDTLTDPATYSLLWNSRFLTFAVSAVAMLLSSYWASRIFKPAALATFFGGHFFLLWGFCLEIAGWARRTAVPDNLLSVETITVSVLFGLYAVLLVSVGVATKTAINRLSGLGLIGIVVLKLYFFDVWQLGRPYQIAAFVILGILLLSTSFLYSHFRRLIETWWKDDKTAA